MSNGSEGMDTSEWRKQVLAAMLNIITDQWIEVDGQRLQIRTAFSKDYHPDHYPWMAISPPAPPNEPGHAADFDIVSPLPNDFPTDYRYGITLNDT